MKQSDGTLKNKRSGAIGDGNLSRTRKIEDEASQKNQADETGRGQRSAIWKTNHAADRGNVQIQTVRSDWRGQNSTRKIEDEASQTNRAVKPAAAGRGGHRVK